MADRRVRVTDENDDAHHMVDVVAALLKCSKKMAADQLLEWGFRAFVQREAPNVHLLNRHISGQDWPKKGR